MAFKTIQPVLLELAVQQKTGVVTAQRGVGRVRLLLLTAAVTTIWAHTTILHVPRQLAVPHTTGAATATPGVEDRFQIPTVPATVVRASTTILLVLLELAVRHGVGVDMGRRGVLNS